MAAFMILFAEQRERHAIRRERVFRNRTQVLDTMQDNELIMRYRFPRHIIFQLIDKVTDEMQPTTYRCHSIPTQIQVLTCLRFLAKGDYLSEIADIHGISKSSSCLVVHRVVNAICNQLKNINFQTGTGEVRKVKSDFHKISGFPNVVGAIDGTHIPIQGMSSDDEHTYVCRKGFHSINVQGVVNSDLRFTNAVCKFPGSTHDSFILQSSCLPDVVSNLQDGGWLLGDSGYPLKEWLMTPIGHPRAGQEERYNLAHCRTRNVVERAFGVLKARFRCLHKTGGSLPYNPQKCAKMIECAIRLHNLAIDNRVPLTEPVEADAGNNHIIAPTVNNIAAAAIRDRLVQRF
ncbi:putative nuclease HARBI1 [Pecten maximus]|uniref:putative nuclease HARBI1 n=1 Tax=Pecten maximus TaxID=6579 RepID=UPI001458F1AA|nr:putative nuclease HARBI1 [Pecten maximus]